MECSRDRVDDFNLMTFLDAVHGANEAAQEHRRDCPGLDLLAGLQGSRLSCLRDTGGVPAFFPPGSGLLLALMDQPLSPPGYQVFLCPGCGSWTVQYDDTLPSDITSHPRFDAAFEA